MIELDRTAAWGGASCEGEEPERGLAALHLRLLKQRIVLISEVVDRELLSRTAAKLLWLDSEQPGEPITLYINSPGGDADSGFALYDMMKFLNSPVRTICSGLCASAGVIIFLGGKPGERFSLPHSRFMIHQPSTGTQGQATDIEITAREILKTRKRYNEIVSLESGRDIKKVSADVDRDFWMDAQEAVDYGLVDRIVNARSEID